MFDMQYIYKELANGLSLREICISNDWPYHKVYRLCKMNNMHISRTSNGKSKATLDARCSSRTLDSCVDDVMQMYNSGSSLADIATKFGSTSATVASSIRRWGGTVRLKNGKTALSAPAHSREVLDVLYTVQGLSSYEIAEMLKYSNHGAVIEDLKYYNIDRRTYKEAGRLLYDKHPEKRDLHRDQFYAGITGPTEGKVTSLEQKFIDWADVQHLPLVHQFQIRSNWHRYDFRIANTPIIVEMDGDFWHSLPEHRERDARFDQTADRHGLVVIRIRESELAADNDTFNKRILPILQEHLCKSEME